MAMEFRFEGVLCIPKSFAICEYIIVIIISTVVGIMLMVMEVIVILPLPLLYSTVHTVIVPSAFGFGSP